MSDVKNFSRKLVPFEENLKKLFMKKNTTEKETQEIIKSFEEEIDKLNYKFFQDFPYKEGKWSWRWPWGCLGGLKSWFYHSWKYVHTKNGNKSLTSGLIILGFTKIDHIWLTTDREEAMKIEKRNAIRFYQYFERLMSLSDEEFEKEISK